MHFYAINVLLWLLVYGPLSFTQEDVGSFQMWQKEGVFLLNHLSSKGAFSGRETKAIKPPKRQGGRKQIAPAVKARFCPSFLVIAANLCFKILVPFRRKAVEDLGGEQNPSSILRHCQQEAGHHKVKYNLS